MTTRLLKACTICGTLTASQDKRCARHKPTPEEILALKATAARLTQTFQSFANE